ncbi:MAG: NADAR family protein [Hyphomicrobium sp.]
MGTTGAKIRTYSRAKAVSFRKTNERFGGLSNMAPGFPLEINRVHIRSSEALYQACRFPHLPNVQRMILNERSPMTAKMKSKPYRGDSRPDWDSLRVRIMKWCLRVKLAQHWTSFGQLLLATGNHPIVEDSRKDDYWGAKTVDDDTLSGQNVLGRLLMELRQKLRENPESLNVVEPLSIPDFLLLGQPIPVIVAQEKPRHGKTKDPRPGMHSFWDPSEHW